MTLGKSPRSLLEDLEFDRTGRSASSKRLNVRLFGELDLRLGDERLPLLDSARARSLLAYLLLNDHAPQSRQRMAFLLWPDSTEGQARTNLRHLLHTLRRTSPELDRFLDVTPQTLRWHPDAAYWLDVAAFESALARADAESDDEFAALREAVSYYIGDLLDGSYDEWLIETRERLRDRYFAALQRLTNLLADRGEHAEAIRLGRELLRSDPLNEDTYRLLMRMHDAADDRAGAVRVYHECVSALQRELGVEPSAATMEAYARLMHSGHRSIEAEPERDPVTAAALVGRDSEWDQLMDCWRDAERGQARLVLVTGEPGIGKSRIVEELATWCAHRGALVGQARSYPTEGELGYGVVISWLRTADVASQLRATYPSYVTELSRFLPELDDGSETMAPTTVDEGDERRRTFDAVALSLTASGRPTLLVADDAQWCDAQSLQLIHYLLRLEPSSPLLIVGTVRREEVDDDHPLGALVGELEMHDRTTEIALGRLTRAATEELALHLTRGALDDTNADALYAETEGNPLFIVETIRAGWDGSRSGGLSPKLQAVISARLRRLSKDARDVLGMAATVGREFAVDSLVGASGIDDIPFVRGLDELWRRGIIREHAIDAYDFSHGKIRDVAYEALSPAARRRNHLLIAEALLKLHKRD
ncbi:MAG: AAA family ATPase, partial [Actinomycetota bacterium]|nr:AAA family ATPase [Actinomycetota bacterium]